jgi:hypothetical protein
VATASENRLTDYQANGAMDLLTSGQHGANGNDRICRGWVAVGVAFISARSSAVLWYRPGVMPEHHTLSRAELGPAN